MGRAPCCDKAGLKKGPWTPEEDKILLDYVQSYGHGSWRSLPKRAGLLRCGKSCRLRWTNYLRPDIKRGPFNPQEQQFIVQLHAIVGNKWSTIAAQLPGRTDNEIKNFWNSHLKKRLRRPATSASATARHTAQWESARLETEARLSRGSVILPECDFFLRIWNSEVGDAFRKKNVGPDAAWDSPWSSTAVKAEMESKSCVNAGASGVDDSSASNDLADNVSVDESYQLYLDFSGGGEQEMGVFGGQIMGLSSVFCGDPVVEACLDTALNYMPELTEGLI